MATDISHNEEVRSNLDLYSAWTEAQIAYRGQPGLSVGIVYDQTVVWSRGFGYADVGEQVAATPATVYRIASITKLFTSTAIMQLRDEGLLQLDDAVSKYLAWFDIRNPYPNAPQLTIRHLITHTAGLPREAAFPYWTTNEFPGQEEIRVAISEQELALFPETDWKYSNLGLSLAGAIVETVSGMTYSEYIHTNILQPLEMENTFVDAVAPDHPQLATGYGRRLPDLSRTRTPYTDCRGIGPAANMASSVEDLAKFVMLQFRDGPRAGKQVLAGSTLREMHRVHWLNDDWTAGRGLGFYVRRLNGRTLVGHGGALLGYRTSIELVPADKVGVIVLTNADDGDPSSFLEKAYKWVVPAMLKAMSDDENAHPEEGWQRYVGRYRDRWGDSQVLVYNGELVLISPTDVDPVAGMAVLKPVGPHTFRIETSERFGDNGELAIFELDEKARVMRLKTGNNYTYPIEHW